MATQGFVKTVLDDSKYSSPVPVIGLYIAGASLVCFLAMFYDIVSGFRHRKQWLPCQWFSLNSVTLTMLGVATKLPVDLTTPMPSALDQISKLSGITFLCIAMAFLMPSVGMKQKSECVNNMVALTIFVVTVVVNICLQIHTGVIFMFVVEHIITMCCMLGLLCILWLCLLIATSEKDSSNDRNKDLITNGKGSMLERLKVAYINAFHYNPQFVLCRSYVLFKSTGLCIICSVALIRAAVKSLSWEFCRGSSDYVWSMWLIVMIQILTIILGSVASVIRCVALPCKANIDLIPVSVAKASIFVLLSNHVLRINTRQGVTICLCVIAVFLLLIPHIIVLYPLICVRFFLRKMFTAQCCKHQSSDHSLDIDKFRHLISGGVEGLQEWVLVKAVKDIKKCSDANRSDSSSQHLSRILSEKLHRSLDHSDVISHRNQVSSLSMVLLVRIAQVSTPPELSATLVKVYHEVYCMIHFIEDRVVSMGFYESKASELAKAVWRGKDFSVLPGLDDILKDSETDLNRARRILQLLKTTADSDTDTVWIEVGRITDIITNRFDNSSVENLYRLMEELFVDMLYDLLVQLPHAIYKEVTVSSAEDFDTRVRLCLGILFKFQSLEAHVNWSFPVGCNIPCLITARNTVDDAGIAAPHLTGDVSDNVSGVVVEIGD